MISPNEKRLALADMRAFEAIYILIIVLVK